MKYIDSYLINDNTEQILPIVAESGPIYTILFEKEHFAPSLREVIDFTEGHRENFI